MVGERSGQVWSFGGAVEVPQGVPSPLEPTTFRLEAELLAGLRTIKPRDGIPATEQVRRAVLDWLRARGIRIELSPRNGRSRRLGRSKR